MEPDVSSALLTLRQTFRLLQIWLTSIYLKEKKQKEYGDSFIQKKKLDASLSD